VKHPNHVGSLVRVTTSQGAELTGFYAAATAKNAPTIVYTHGLSGGFDTNFIYNLLALPDAGQFNVLSTTSTGHGNIATTRRGSPPLYKLTGSAFEIFTDCVHDLSAWLDLAATGSSGPIILWGHSLGASKVTHYLAQTGDPRVAGLVLASPSDVTAGFCENVGWERLPGLLDQARELVAAGRPEALMPDDCVIGLLKQRISAGTMLDRFEEGQPADMFDFYDRSSKTAFRDLANIDRPILVVYCKAGELFGPGGADGATTMIRKHAVKSPQVDAVVVGGNHWYVGCEDDAMGGLLNWSKELVGSTTTNTGTAR
jgi:pimeloyl-ACP methyl ester carboxylesterase